MRNTSVGVRQAESRTGTGVDIDRQTTLNSVERGYDPEFLMRPESHSRSRIGERLKSREERAVSGCGVIKLPPRLYQDMIMTMRNRKSQDSTPHGSKFSSWNLRQPCDDGFMQQIQFIRQRTDEGFSPEAMASARSNWMSDPAA